VRLPRLLPRRGGPDTIVDGERQLGEFSNTNVEYDTTLRKEEVARQHVFDRPGADLAFLDVGARDGRLEYLLGIRQNLEFDAEMYEANIERFRVKYRYYGLDLEPAGDAENVISGDICADDFLRGVPGYEAFFDVIYSNNVFEHLRRPWVASRNLLAMLKPGGICITIAPFALRYHESPEDHFRYTHTGIMALFSEHEEVKELVSGYDITGRRNNWQGLGQTKDICPVDRFGAWRENWFVVSILQKQG
jgi:SAM-dependent methyltransferase